MVNPCHRIAVITDTWRPPDGLKTVIALDELADQIILVDAKVHAGPVGHIAPP